MKTLLEQISNKCIHFNGVMNKECKAGIVYSEVRDKDARPFLFPCLNQGGYCDKCQFPTEKQIKDTLNEIETGGAWAINTLMKVREEVKDGEHGFGMIDCDCGGIIHYSVAEINGHVRARCNKCENSFME